MSRKRNRVSTAVITAAVICVVFSAALLTATGYLAYKSRSQPVVQYPQLEPEARVQSGTLSDPAGRQAELDAMVQEGMLSFSINVTPFIDSVTGEANLLIENPPGNGNRFTVSISLEETGEEIYKSGYLDPEQYIETAPLDQALPAGEYPCLAYFDAYRMSDNAYIGRGTAKITLFVQN